MPRELTVTFIPRDRAVYLPAVDVLVAADLHVGKTAASPVEASLGERDDLVERLEALLARFEPATVVLAGDLLHSFGSFPAGVGGTIRGLERVIAATDADVLVTPGNHDTLLDELWDGPTTPEYVVETDDTVGVITHGHVAPETDADWYVVGHDHPTIEIEGVRHPCYLAGPDQYAGADLLMVPAFSRVPVGTAINGLRAGDFMSPLVTTVDALRPIVRDEAADRTHTFPPMGELRSLL